MATTLICGGCSYSAFSGGVKFNETWRGPVVYLIPNASGAFVLNFDKVLNGFNVIPGTLIIRTSGGYIADDVTNTVVNGARQIQTQNSTTVVGSVSSYNGRLTGTITFPSAPADGANIFITFQTTQTGTKRDYTALAARAWNEDPCLIPSLATPCALNVFATDVCDIDVCAGDKAGIYVDDLLVLAAAKDGAFVNVGAGLTLYSWDFTAVAADYSITGLLFEGTDVIAAAIAATTNVAGIVTALNGNAQTSGIGQWFSSGNVLSVRTNAVLGNISGTGNSVAFDLAPTVTAAPGFDLDGYWITRSGITTICNCSNTTSIYAFSGVGIPCTSIVTFRNGTQVVRLDGQTVECLYTFTLPAVAGSGYVITQFEVNGVPFFGPTQSSAGATTALLVAALNAEASTVGAWTAPSATTIAVRSRQVLGNMQGTNNGSAISSIAVAVSGCV